MLYLLSTLVLGSPSALEKWSFFRPTVITVREVLCSDCPGKLLGDERREATRWGKLCLVRTTKWGPVNEMGLRPTKCYNLLGSLTCQTEQCALDYLLVASALTSKIGLTPAKWNRGNADLRPKSCGKKDRQQAPRSASKREEREIRNKERIGSSSRRGKEKCSPNERKVKFSTITIRTVRLILISFWFWYSRTASRILKPEGSVCSIQLGSAFFFIWDRIQAHQSLREKVGNIVFGLFQPESESGWVELWLERPMLNNHQDGGPRIHEWKHCSEKKWHERTITGLG